jgi:flagellar assembly protein FliH
MSEAAEKQASEPSVEALQAANVALRAELERLRDERYTLLDDQARAQTRLEASVADARRQAYAQGHAQGHAEGKAAGRAEGRREGRQELAEELGAGAMKAAQSVKRLHNQFPHLVALAGRVVRTVTPGG